MIMKQKHFQANSLFLPLLLAVGCVTQIPRETTGPGAGDRAASFTNQQFAGYSEQKGDECCAATGVSAADLAVGEKIREMLMEDKTLAPAPSNVITVVSRGVVTMKGYIRSRRAAFELHQRIANLPGVVSVQDELVLWNGHKI
jgi:osmotically-inducible protein OsmY